MFSARFCAAALGLAMLSAAPASAEIRQAYIGSYTPNPAAPATAANAGEGISLVDVDSETGAISNIRVVAKVLSPSWIALSKDRRFLYSVNETDTFDAQKSGGVSAFAVAPDGGLTLINTVASGGAGPCYLSVDPSGKFVLVANYTAGAFAVIRIKPDGGLGERTDLVDANLIAATETRPARGHMIDFDRTGQFVIGADAGRNRIFVWKLDRSGKLAQVSVTETAARTAPRHFVFSPDNKTLYQLMEASSELGVFAFDAGKLTAKGANVSALPPGYVGVNTASELLISKDGSRLYFANRTHDSIATFQASPAGVTRLGAAHTEGDTPRSLTLDPAGKFVFSLNQRANNVTVFGVEPDGQLKFTGRFVGVGTPAVMVFK